MLLNNFDLHVDSKIDIKYFENTLIFNESWQLTHKSKEKNYSSGKVKKARL